jgi:hypothetical protein
MTQPALFTQHSQPAVSGVPGARRHPAASDTALTGDEYGWLADLLATILPETPPPACEGCGRPAVLPTTAPVLWTCPDCHPSEAP